MGWMDGVLGLEWEGKPDFAWRFKGPCRIRDVKAMCWRVVDLSYLGKYQHY